ncbi:MAG: hypothetical protein WBE34_02345 [Candidatus Nitrosopolaris sp.]
MSELAALPKDLIAPNHYAGFGPGTVNIFRDMLGLPEAKWEDKQGEQEQEAIPQDDLDVKQSTLSGHGAWLLRTTGAGRGLMFQYPDKFGKVIQTFLTTTPG